MPSRASSAGGWPRGRPRPWSRSPRRRGCGAWRSSARACSAAATTRCTSGLLSSAAQIAASTLDGLAAGSRPRAAGAAAAGGPGAPAVAEPPAAPPRDEDLAALRARFPALDEIVGEGAALTATLRELSKVAPTRFPVLILGPTGTGKELAARAVHRMSPRAAGPFEVVDCGAIPDELIESELFGHVRGAFTGAARDRRGAFELAHGGTLFLDEIGELPPAAQTKLLRVLQEGQLRRVGDERLLHVNVRVVAATNRDLLTEVQRGRFRPDLYYRVGVFTVRMPTLAERREDLPLLVRFLAERYAAEAGTPVPRVPQAVLRRLAEYSFPGNIRELQNILTVLLLRSGPEGLRVEELEEMLTQAGEGRPAGGAPAAEGAGADTPARGDLEAVGRWVLEQARKCDFNLAQAERALARLRQSPAGRAAAPVADRSSLTYYLQGECFRAFVEARFDLGVAARAVAGQPDLEPQARARLARFLDFVAEVAGACRARGDRDARSAAAGCPSCPPRTCPISMRSPPRTRAASGGRRPAPRRPPTGTTRPRRPACPAPTGASSTRQVGGRLRSSSTGFTSTRSIAEEPARVGDHLHRQVRLAVGDAAAHRRARRRARRAGRSQSMSNETWKPAVPSRAIAQRLLHHRAHAALVDVAHGEDVDARAADDLALARRRSSRACRPARRSPASHLGREAADPRQVAVAQAERRCASGMPWTLPDGVVSGVFMSAWASNQISPNDSPRPRRKRATPATEPMATEWSPPSTSGR